LKLAQVFSGNCYKGGAENFDLHNLRVPGMDVSGKFFRRRKGHFKPPQRNFTSKLYKIKNIVLINWEKKLPN
jgi:hypothetical protein